MKAQSKMKYSINKIQLIAESGKAYTLPVFDRRIIRQTLHNNIESHNYYGRNTKLTFEQRTQHFEEAKKLKTYLSKIPSNK